MINTSRSRDCLSINWQLISRYGMPLIEHCFDAVISKIRRQFRNPFLVLIIIP